MLNLLLLLESWKFSLINALTFNISCQKRRISASLLLEPRYHNQINTFWSLLKAESLLIYNSGHKNILPDPNNFLDSATVA